MNEKTDTHFLHITELFVDRDASFFNALICPICRCVFNDAVLTGATNHCTHTFCFSCLNDHVKASLARNEEEYPKCPVCREQMRSSWRSQSNRDAAQNFPINITVRELISRLKMRCLHYEEGCLWTGYLDHQDPHEVRRNQSILSHLEEECDYAVRDCKHKGCSRTKMPGKMRKIHQLECEFRPVDCVQCNKSIKFNEIDSHLNQDCEEQVIFCPNRCTQETTEITATNKRVKLQYNTRKRVKLEYNVTNAQKNTNEKNNVDDAIEIKTNTTTKTNEENNAGGAIAIQANTSTTTQFKRKELADHCNMNCPLQIILCTYAEFGCNWKGMRKDAQDHIIQETVTHANLVCSTSEMYSNKKSNPYFLNVVVPYFHHYGDSKWREKLKVGDLVDCQDTDNVWFLSHIDQVNLQQKTVHIQYIGWGERYDEWLSTASDRIQRPFHMSNGRIRTIKGIESQVGRVVANPNPVSDNSDSDTQNDGF